MAVSSVHAPIVDAVAARPEPYSLSEDGLAAFNAERPQQDANRDTRFRNDRLPRPRSPATTQPTSGRSGSPRLERRPRRSAHDAVSTSSPSASAATARSSGVTSSTAAFGLCDIPSPYARSLYDSAVSGQAGL
jgi:hypothetical protein